MGLQRNQCSDGLLCNQIRSIILVVEFSLTAMEFANALPINFRRGCSVLEVRLRVGDGGFAVSLKYSSATCCGVRARSVFSDLIPGRRRYEQGCNAAKALDR